jgi:hypothetical protein
MKPLILEFVENRNMDDSLLKYEYDHELSLNVVTLKDKKIPLINLDSEVLNTKTITRQQMEGMDIEYDLVGIRIITKAESDEVQNPFSYIMELKTKTLTERERDDHDFINLQ